MLRFFGCPYPIIKHPRGLLRTQNGIDQIKSDLLVLLLTNPGERCMLPEFGTPLRRLLFDPNDPLIAEQAREIIINSISMWEPRVVISEINVSIGSDEGLHEDDTKEEIDHILKIQILLFDPENINDIQELKLEVPLAGGN